MRPEEKNTHSDALIVEDDPAFSHLLSEELAELGFSVSVTHDAETAWRRLQRRPFELVLTDVRLPGRDGIDLLTRCQGLPVKPGFIVVTAFGTIEQAVGALKRGADDFLTKPLDFDHLRVCIQRVIEHRRLRQEVALYRRLFEQESFHGIVGRSVPMRALFDNVRQIARANGPVLILGESGTGKELVARAIHAESSRADRPFVPLNCAGIPQHLLESELFGHLAGAFTGAGRARKGLFVEADGGTLLLDEIGELPMDMQAKLLRVLQDGRVRPLGANSEHELDVRVIAATNRNLEEEAKAGRFREDLFYRLETFAVTVPPLRERADDLELLAAHLIAYFGMRLDRRIRGLTARALDRLKSYAFPGNVRELSNAMERAVTFCNGSMVDLADLPQRLATAAPAHADAQPEESPLLDPGEPLPALADVQHRYVRYVLGQVANNKQRAAQILGIGRRTLYRYLDPDA